MKKVTKLKVNEHYGIYTSADHLNDLYRSGAIDRESKVVRSGMHWSLSCYKFITKDGTLLAEVEKYSDWGFCDQAFGTRLFTDTLTPKRVSVKIDIMMIDYEMYQKYPILAKIGRNLRIFNNKQNN